MLLLNDDVTPMEFVVHVLEEVFGKTRDEATTVMLAVHQGGKGVCGIYGRKEAQRIADRVQDLANAKGFPLRCAIKLAKEIESDVMANAPAMWSVVLVNEDPARMDLVARILEEVCQIPPEQAGRFLARVHARGWTACIPRTHQEAERVRARVAELAAEENCEVKCIVVPLSLNSGDMEERIGLSKIIFSEVHADFHFDGPALASPEFDPADIFPTVKALQHLVMIGDEKFNENGCLERIRSETLYRHHHSIFFFDPDLLDTANPKTGVDLARDIGFISGSQCSLFKLIKSLAEHECAELTAPPHGGDATLSSPDGKITKVSQDVYSLAIDPSIRQYLGMLVEPLLKPGCDVLSFMEDDIVVDALTKGDARLITEFLGLSVGE